MIPYLQTRRPPAIRILQISLVAALLLSACGTPTPSDATPSATRPAATPTRRVSPTPRPTPTQAGLDIPAADLEGIVVRLWHPWTGALARALDQQVQEFNESNPWGIQAEASAMADQGDLYETVLQASSGEDGPGVAIANPEQAAAWDDASGLVADLTDYVHDPQWGLSASEVVDFPAVFWNTGLDGERRLGVPLLRSARVLFYNRSWAEELGFSSEPRTPDQFADQACTAARALNNDNNWENNGTGGWILDHDALTILSWLEGFGAEPVGAPGDAYDFSGRPAETALSYLRGIYDDGCAWSARLPDSPGYFSRRQALFFSGSLDEITALARAMQFAENGDEWSAIPFPAEDQRQPIFFGPSLHVLKDEPAEGLAGWLLVRWLVSPESQTALARAAGALPVRQSALDGLVISTRTLPEWKAAAAFLEDGVSAPVRADWRIARRVLEDAHRQVYAANTLPKQIPEILAQLDRTIAEVVERTR